MPKLALQQGLVNTSTCPEGKKKVDYFDTKVRGLYLEIRSSGTRTFYLRYTDKWGKIKSIKISNNADLKLKEVRLIAESLRSDIARGVDPAAEQNKHKSTMLFEELVSDYYEPYAITYKKSYHNDASNLKNHILPVIGKLRLDQITPANIEQIVKRRLDRGGAPGSANLSLILVKYIFNLAISRWEVNGLEKNPAANIKALPSLNTKERYLSPEESIRLAAAVNNSKCKMLRFIFPMLLLTGARKREVLDAVWQDIDFEDQTWLIKRTKNGKPRQAFLCHQLLDMLFFLRSLNYSSTYVFPNPRSGQPYKNIFTAWRNARERAGMATFRLHDLRHSFASMLINEGRSLYEVQKLLGHTSSTMTQRYAHLAKDTLREAAGVASSKVTTVIDTSDLGGVTRDETADVDDEQLQLHLL